MALSAARPAMLRGAVLNDIGPVIEGKGLARIRGYVGKLPPPANEREAVEILKNLMSAQFTALSEEVWASYARATWKEDGGRLVLNYDPALMRTLEAVNLEAPLPPLWFLFEGLKRVPVLALRGANSDLVSAETVEAMKAAHPRLEVVTVPDQGHAPLLQGREIIQQIRRFVTRIENAAEPTGSRSSRSPASGSQPSP
jgi:pimeloyl-ACP methyl ester carboxylesterase